MPARRNKLTSVPRSAETLRSLSKLLAEFGKLRQKFDASGVQYFAILRAV